MELDKKGGSLDPIIVSGTNGPMVIILVFVPPEDILKNIIHVDRFFYDISFLMMERRIFRWNRKHIKPLFGSLIAPSGSKKNFPYVCEKLTMKLVKILKLRRIPSSSFGDFDLVSYASKRGYYDMLQHSLVKLISINRKPSNNVLEIAVRTFQDGNMSRLTLCNFFHCLLKDFPRDLKINDDVFACFFEFLDLKSFQLLFKNENYHDSKLIQFEISPFRPAFLRQLVKIKCKSEEDERKRREIYKILRNHFFGNQHLSYILPWFETLESEFIELIITSKVKTKEEIRNVTLGCDYSNIVLDCLLKNKLNELIDRLLQYHMKKIPEYLTLLHSISPCSSMVTYIMIYKSEEELDEYIDLLKIRRSQNSGKYEQTIKYSIHLENIFHSTENNTKQEIISKYSQKMEKVLNSNLFEVKSKTLESFQMDYKIFSFLLKYSERNSIHILYRSCLKGINKKQDDDIICLLIDKYFEDMYLIKILIRNNRLDLFEYFLKNDEISVFQLTECLIESIEERKNKFRDLILKVCLEKKKNVLSEKVFDVAFNSCSNYDFLLRIIKSTEEENYLSLINCNRASIIMSSLNKQYSSDNRFFIKIEKEEEEDLCQLYYDRLSRISSGDFFRVSDKMIFECIYGNIPMNIFVGFVKNNYTPSSFYYFQRILNSCLSSSYSSIRRSKEEEEEEEKDDPIKLKYLRHVITTLYQQQKWKKYYLAFINSHQNRKRIMEGILSIITYNDDNYAIYCDKCKKKVDILKNDIFFCIRCSKPEFIVTISWVFCDENNILPEVSPTMFCKNCVFNTFRTKIKHGKSSSRLLKYPCFCCKNKKCLSEEKTTEFDDDDKW